jgi:hypothetical protein
MNTCGHPVPWDNGWWPMSSPCTKKPHDGGTHIAEFRSFGGVPMWAILRPGDKEARVYVDTRWRPPKDPDML